MSEWVCAGAQGNQVLSIHLHVLSLRNELDWDCLTDPSPLEGEMSPCWGGKSEWESEEKNWEMGRDQCDKSSAKFCMYCPWQLVGCMLYHTLKLCSSGDAPGLIKSNLTWGQMNGLFSHSSRTWWNQIRVVVLLRQPRANTSHLQFDPWWRVGSGCVETPDNCGNLSSSNTQSSSLVCH